MARDNVNSPTTTHPMASTIDPIKKSNTGSPVSAKSRDMYGSAARKISENHFSMLTAFGRSRFSGTGRFYACGRNQPTKRKLKKPRRV